MRGGPSWVSCSEFVVLYEVKVQLIIFFKLKQCKVYVGNIYIWWHRKSLYDVYIIANL